MKNELVGWCVIISKKSGCGEQYETLNYGRGKDPYPDELARDRGAALFDTKTEAKQAIERCKESGGEWQKKFNFGVLPIFKLQLPAV